MRFRFLAFSLVCLSACQQDPFAVSRYAYEHHDQWAYCHDQSYKSEVARVECEEKRCKPLEIKWRPSLKSQIEKVYALRRKYAKLVDAGEMTKKEAEDALARDQRNNYKDAVIATSDSSHEALKSH